jgi:hypothetical protein
MLAYAFGCLIELILFVLIPITLSVFISGTGE